MNEEAGLKRLLAEIELLLRDGLVVGKLGVVAVVAVELELEEANELRELRNAHADEENVGSDRGEEAVGADHPVGSRHHRGEHGKQAEHDDEGRLGAGVLAQLEVNPRERGQNAEHERSAQDEGEGEEQYGAHFVPFLLVVVFGSETRCPEFEQRV